MKKEKKIIIVYHAYMYGDKYMAMMVEQFRKLIKSGLYWFCDKIYIGVVDTPNKKPFNGIDWVHDFWKFSSSKKTDKASKPKVEIVVYPDNKEEANTLKWIRDYSAKHPGDYILYFHTKGITKQNAATEDWRRYMEYFVIENWFKCFEKLTEGYDCCGVLWNDGDSMGHYPHFSGGMWWANTNYINTLKHEYLDLSWRFYREFWIGSNPNAKCFEFHNSGLNDTKNLQSGRCHYTVEYPRSKYVKYNAIPI